MKSSGLQDSGLEEQRARGRRVVSGRLELANAKAALGESPVPGREAHAAWDGPFACWHIGRLLNRLGLDPPALARAHGIDLH